ncbi:MAG: Unknown protein [uncultured Aureispira sp.]|uniref:NarX-like N-terminal domain-containing protein n=1 Tax=uncultured Aureispira sp. TaxID=1331704 RepID=A0A6S6UIM3_9BACT|nr:MAG: Unknown protein [uncultured Aureispira sp.]
MQFIILLILVLGTNVSFATTVGTTPENAKMSIYETINKAGYQRMLTQRIAKSYMAIVCNLDHEKQEEHLKGSAKIFEKNLEDLDYSAPNEAIQTKVHYVKTLWQKNKFLYKNVYTEENALKVLTFNNEILKACDDVVLLLEEYAIKNEASRNKKNKKSTHSLSSIINFSGKQRMLTQRILLFSLANSYSIGDKELQVACLKESIRAFEELFRALISCSKNTAEIDEELDVSSKAWVEMKKELNNILSSENNTAELKEQLAKMMQLGEEILFSFDEVAFLYEREQ